MNVYERRKLELLRQKFGHLSVEEALDLAIQSETFAKDCGPFDPAFEHFAYNQLMLESLALLTERSYQETRNE